MSIQNYLNQIKNAVFGKDVRQSIYDAIKQCYDDASINHDNANMEVKLARGSHDTLNERFTSVEEYIKITNEQLDKKANKNDVAKISSGTPIFVDSVEEMTDTTKNYVNLNDKYVYIYNGSDFEKTDVLYQAQGIEDKSVTSEKIDDDFVYDTGIYESAKLLTMSNLINNYDFRKGKEDWLLEYNTTGEVSGNEITVNSKKALGRLKSKSLGTYALGSRFYLRFGIKTDGIKVKAGICSTSNNNFHSGAIDIENNLTDYTYFSALNSCVVDADLSLIFLSNNVLSDTSTFTLKDILLIDLQEIFPSNWKTISKEEVENFIATYTNSKAFLKQSTDIVNATKFLYSIGDTKGKFFVYKNESDVSITYKYDNDNDIRVTFGKRGGNNIFDLKNIIKIPNSFEDVSTAQSGNAFYTSYTDTLGPYIVEAINNIDGDNPSASGHFTGGNHNYNNDGTTGTYSATGRTSDVVVKVDGVIKDTINEYANRIDIYWTNYIQGFNTKKVDGTGREILKENYHVWFDGEKFNVENLIEALEEIKINLYYGMQLSYGSWNEGVLYLNSSERSWQSGSGGHYGYNKKCNKVRFKKGNDYAEMYMSYDGIGDKELSNTNYGAVTFNYGKSYFYPLNIPTTLQPGEILTFNGYYKFYSK